MSVTVELPYRYVTRSSNMACEFKFQITVKSSPDQMTFQFINIRRQRFM